MSKIPRWFGFSVLAGVVLVAVAAGYSPRAASPAYLTAEVRIDDIEYTVLASGIIEPLTLVNVGAQVSGQLVKLHVRVGDKVEAGQLIGQIDSLPQQNTLRNAQAALEYVRAQRLSRIATLKQAELAYARQRDMLAADATPGKFTRLPKRLSTPRVPRSLRWKHKSVRPRSRWISPKRTWVTRGSARLSTA